eukprot:800677-Pleurochrysis_carterae.AAC.1
MVLSGLVSSASSTSFGRDSEAGALVLWNAKGIPAGREAHGGFIGSNVDVQEVRYWPLVFDVPTVGESFDEGVVERAGAVVRIQREQVVHVAAYSESVLNAVDDFGH